MRRYAPFLAILGLLWAAPDRAESQALEAGPDLTYADLADLALNAPIAALAEVDRVRRVDEERAIGLAPGHVRYYVEAELETLIRSPAPVPARISYLVDMPLDADGRRPRIDDRRVILLAAPVPGRGGEIQLIAPDAQLDWTAQREETIRAILNEAASANAPGIVTGVGSAFSVPGALPGESETQIFLATSDGRPVSISVLRRPNQQPRWSVSHSEIVESSVPPPMRNTLLWYRLACFLPDRLPDSSMETMDRSQIATARADFRMVVEELGRCPRTRQQ